MTSTRFNIRVYILLFNAERTHILLSDEKYNGHRFTKFPGGGLEFGEGILDCLHREALEEFGQEVEVIEQFYTSETYQPSRFIEGDQIICVYYKCWLALDSSGERRPRFNVSERKFDFQDEKAKDESFRWKELVSLEESDLSLPLDQHIVSRLNDDLFNV